MATTQTGPTSLRTALPVLVRDVAGPYLVYLALHDLAGWTNLSALVGASVAAAALVLLGLVRSRQLDPLAGIVLLTTLAGVVVALRTGDARATLARESVVSGALGIAFVLSLLRRPLLFSMLWALRGGEDGPAEGWRRATPRQRSAMRTGTVVVGAVLVLDALLRVTAVLLLPVSTAAGVVTALTIATVVVIVGWMRWFLPRRYREPQQA